MRLCATRPLVLAALALSLGACRGPTGPVEIPPEEIPFSLERSPTPSPTATGFVVTVYLVNEGRLVAVDRAVPAETPLPEVAMRALLAGPTEEERAQGISSSIPPATGLLRVEVMEGVAEVDLGPEFQSPAPPEEVLLRVAQVVWTLLGLPGTSAARFAVEGEPVAVVTDGQEVVERPVTTSDYGSVAPAPVP